MEPAIHSYPLSVRAIRWLLLVVGFFYIVTILIVFSDEIVRLTMGLVSTAAMIFIVAWCWNLQPEIIAKEDGLSVHFLFWWLPVKWEDIVDVRPHFLIKVLRKILRLRGVATFVVRTRSLTFFHRFYFYPTFSFLPSFAIFRNISRFDELLSFMKKFIPEKMES